MIQALLIIGHFLINYSDFTHEETVEVLGEERIFNMTAYTAGPESTGKRPGDKGYGITRTGTHVKEGRTIACPESMVLDERGVPLEDPVQIYIPYFDNTFTCEDTGSAITEGHLDIYMEDLQRALEFGRRDLEAIILD